jgi:hypothetical protein
LLSISLPEGIRKGEVYNVTVKQVTSVIGAGKGRGGAAGTVVLESAAASAAQLRWRRVLGVFHLRIPVSTRQALLGGEERRLSIMRSIGQSIPTDSRWYKVFHRYLDQLAVRVTHMGGDPARAVPDPNGDWNGRIRGTHGEMQGGGGTHGVEVVSFCGRVCGILYDRRGEFDGFLLDTEHGTRRFESRERGVESLVRRAWARRMLIAVFSEGHHAESVGSILLLEPSRGRR